MIIIHLFLFIGRNKLHHTLNSGRSKSRGWSSKLYVEAVHKTFGRICNFMPVYQIKINQALFGAFLIIMETHVYHMRLLQYVVVEQLLYNLSDKMAYYRKMTLRKDANGKMDQKGRSHDLWRTTTRRYKLKMYRSRHFTGQQILTDIRVIRGDDQLRIWTICQSVIDLQELRIWKYYSRVLPGVNSALL